MYSKLQYEFRNAILPMSPVDFDECSLDEKGNPNFLSLSLSRNVLGGHFWGLDAKRKGRQIRFLYIASYRAILFYRFQPLIPIL